MIIFWSIFDQIDHFYLFLGPLQLEFKQNPRDGAHLSLILPLLIFTKQVPIW